MIRVTRSIVIDESELEFDFVRSSGPGGQNVNKVATAVQLRFDARKSDAISEEVFQRLRRLAGRRMTSDGVVVITARRFRRQERNRDDAVDRLVDLIKRAAQRPKSRKKTRPTAASRQKRLDDKRRASQKKARRRPVRGSDE